MKGGNHRKMEKSEARKDLEEELVNLKAELKERESILPAHSIRPHQLLAIEELEGKIRILEEKLRLLPPPKPGGERR